MLSASEDLLRFADKRRFGTILADPPWRFINKTGKIAPEHKRLSRYGTMKLDEIKASRSPTWPLQPRIFICGARTRCCPMAWR